MEKNINLQRVLFFLRKTKPKKQNKKIINISYLMMLIKMRLLIFLVLSHYGLACKYGIIFQISIYAELDFVMPGITIANQATLKQKFDSI